MKKWLTKKWLWTVAVGLGLVVWYLSASDKPSENLSEIVRRGAIEQTVHAIGDVSPLHLVDVGAQASGQVKKMYVKLGQEVKKGDLIAEIDAETQQNELDTALSRLHIAKEQLSAKKISLSVAQRQYQRERALWAEEATSKSSLDTASETFANARAAMADAEVQIKQAEISVKNARNTLGHTRIIAPMDGTVVSIRVEEGQTLNASQSAPAIVQMADLRKMLLKMQIAEGDLSKVKPGMKVSFTTLSEPDRVRSTVLDSIDPGLTVLSQGSYNTGTDTSTNAVYYYARATAENEDRKLAVGMTTQNVIVTQSVENVLLIPTMAIHTRGKGQKYVRILTEGGEIKEQEIVTGLSDNMNTEVKSGVQEGQEVVLEEAAQAVSDTAAER